MTTTPEIRLDGARILVAFGAKDHRNGFAFSIDSCGALDLIAGLTEALRCLPEHIIAQVLAERPMPGGPGGQARLPGPGGFDTAECQRGGALSHWASCIRHARYDASAWRGPFFGPAPGADPSKPDAGLDDSEAEDIEDADDDEGAEE